jgi:hypothetical protein|tara:strand:- start:552 stop:1709 length:1158 start_codon:yes stop_codon:yes gene_type:complete
MKNLILGYKRGKNKWQCLQKALENCDVVTEDFDKIEGPYDRIYTVAESLLPLQATLEKKWGLNNLSEKAADILSDKAKMDAWCGIIGLQNLIPFSVIPTNPGQLDRFKESPFIIKPIIGSGSKPGGLNYISFKNKKEFLLSIGTSEFFTNNKTGWKDSEFNNRINQYMAQEQLPTEAEIWGPYYYVNENGILKNVLWVRGKVAYSQIDEYRYETKPVEWMSFKEQDVPTDIKQLANNFFERLIGSLHLRNMFFSGPDFYKWDNNVKMIDCNPRIGQGLQQMDDVHNNTMIPRILENKPFDYKKQIYWVMADLKPGKIKNVRDLSHLKEYLVVTNYKLKPGMEIPNFHHLVSLNRTALIITGTNESDMLKTYQTVNNQLQDCISYY